MNIARATREMGRRRVPRREYEAQIGLLYDGNYSLERCHQVGEGGMMIASHRPLKENDRVVITFFVLNTPIVVRGEVRSITAAKGHMPARYGVEFSGLEFVFKREIRNFVASAVEQKRTFA